ncbi:hypothetical protein EMPS_01727 [Entomortierella parvispora]|uniref:Uncharacterized protein n=1 Tax=Entomortierella parvispora TaxID=205924 RepID=A0A9P3H3D7_9FUNG|nr:hypothetical protein EMPS_01727 [Entomortierella parvispora]
MANSTLLGFRILLVILTTIVMACDLVLIIRYHVEFAEQYWSIWLALIISIVSNVAYSLSLRQRTFFDPRSRAIMMCILCAGWYVAPSYHIHVLLRYYGAADFFKGWACGLLQCTMWMIADICGLATGVFGFVEAYLAERHDRSHVQKPLAATTIFVSPTVQQNTQYIPLEQQHQHQPLLPQQQQQYQYPQHQPLQQQSPYQPQPYYPQMSGAGEAASYRPEGYY